MANRPTIVYSGSVGLNTAHTRAASIPPHAGMTHRQIIARMLASIAAASLAGCDRDVVRIPPPAPWKAPAAGSSAPVSQGSKIQLAAPHVPQNSDEGVAEAARQFAIQLVRPDLARPESAEFPPDTISIKRLDLVGRSNGGRIEEWLVDGAVDSKNRYGLRIGSHWRMVLGRDDNRFFPVRAALEGVQIFRMSGDVEMLAEARRAEVEYREAQAAALRTEELAASRAAWKALDEAKPVEEKADAALKLAKSLLDAGREEPARRRLQEVIDKFPETRAAARAEELLAK